MANILTTRPLQIDTAMGASFNNGASVPKPLRVTKLYWLNPTTVGHTLVITDAGGNLLFSGKCEVAGQAVIHNFTPTVRWKDFKVTTIGSGTLFIYTA